MCKDEEEYASYIPPQRGTRFVFGYLVDFCNAFGNLGGYDKLAEIALVFQMHLLCVRVRVRVRVRVHVRVRVRVRVLVRVRVRVRVRVCARV